LHQAASTPDALTAVSAWPRHRTACRPCLSVQTEPFLSVVVVNYHSWRATTQLVGQIQDADSARDGHVEVLIVDNHSPAHPAIASLRRRPGVSLRRWGCNHGFARAVNAGCRLASGQWLLLLNPDVSLPAGFLDGAIQVARDLRRDAPTAGIVGFRLRNPDGSPQGSVGRFPSLLGTLAGLAFPRHDRKYFQPSAPARCRVPWVTGCCLLVHRDCLHQLGGFDEDFFLYYEDVDFCRRAWQSGWSVWYEPGLHVVHHRPLHVRRVPPHIRVCTRHSLLTYAVKHWPRWQVQALARLVEAEAWLRRCWAVFRRDTRRAEVFADLTAIARQVRTGQCAAARRRLLACVRREERAVS
jgi:GT2 family glycosyltransferase